MAAPKFTQRDVVAAVAGARNAGVEIGRIEIDRATGRIFIYAAGREPKPEPDDGSIEAWLAEHADDEPQPPRRRRRGRGQ